MTPAAMAVVETAQAGLAAVGRGATIVQLRAPAGSTRRLQLEAERLVADASMPVLVSSRLDVALAVGAAGANLPEADIPIAQARRLAPGAVLGRSVHSRKAALDAEVEGADYVIFGPVFETPSHPGRPGAGLAALEDVAGALRIPVLAIGGVSGDRRDQVLAAGAAGYASISAFRA